MNWKTMALMGAILAGSTLANDYPKVNLDRAKIIGQMESGSVKNAIKLQQRTVDFPWRLCVPETQTPGEKFPLVVFLHGAGRRGTDNIGPMELAWPFASPEAQKQHPCFVLAGQVPQGRCWTPALQAREKLVQEGKPIEITDEMTALLSVVDQLLKDKPIDPKRIYVGGQSLGGYGTWDALERRPGLWAAAVPICGGGSPGKAETFKDVPIWAWHGENDTTVPVRQSREMVEALKAAGGNPRYTEVPKGGHGVWNNAFADPELFAWLFSQSR